MKYNAPIPLQQAEKYLIIKSIQDGDYEDREIRKEHPTRTHNGRGASIWNHINTQIDKNFNNDKFLVGSIWRGGWELVYLYDRSTKYLYTLMRGKNYTGLKNKKLADTVNHYSNLLSVLNGELLNNYEKENEQYSFGLPQHFDYDTSDQVEKALNTIISSINGEILCYCLILFEQQNGIVNHIEVKIPVFGMSSVYTEDWSEFIKPQYYQEYEKDNNIELPETDIDISVRDDNIKLFERKRDNKKKKTENK